MFVLCILKLKSEIQLASWGVVSVNSEITTCCLPQLSNVHFVKSLFISCLMIVKCFISVRRRIASMLNANQVYVTNAFTNFWIQFPAVITRNDVLEIKAKRPVVQSFVHVAATMTFCVIVRGPSTG